jgi:high-affinity nickel-transport protein
VGALLLIFGLSVPPRLAAGLELCVAVMLVVLGLLNLLRKPAHHVHVTGLEPGSAARSVGVGLVHGLAGSAAVALLALGAVHDPRWAAAYLLVFGVGTLVGMTFMTVLLALPLTMGVARLGAHARHVVPIMGLLSVAMGIVLACEVGGGIFSQAGVGIFSSAPHP